MENTATTAKLEKQHSQIDAERVSPSPTPETVTKDLAAEPEQHVHAKTIVLLIAVVGMYFVQVVFSGGVGVLSGTITGVVGGGNRSTWLTASIAICAGILSPPISQAADLWGRKWLLIGFSVCGGVGCLIASRANNFGVLIAGQVIGALSGGAQPIIHAVASEILPRKYRTFAQAATATAGGLGGIFGTLVAGALTKNDPNHFRIYYYIVTAMFWVGAVIVALLYNPPLRELQTKLTQWEKIGRLDWIGNALFVPGLLLFSFALTSAGELYPWKNPKVVGPLVVGGVLLIAFILYEWLFTKEGILHHAVFTSGRNFPLAYMCFFIEGLVFFATNRYYAYESVALYGKDTFSASTYYAVGFITLVVVTQLTGAYCSRSKTLRGPLVVGFTSFTIFAALMSSLTPSTRHNILGYVPFFGLGIGITLNLLVATAQFSAPKELISITTGLVIGVRSIGGTVGLAIFSAIFSGTLNNNLASKVIKETTAVGFDPQYLETLLSGLESHNSTLLDGIPGITSAIIAAAELGEKEAYTLSFRYVWISVTVFTFLAAISTYFPLLPSRCGRVLLCLLYHMAG
ncbi:hypothetical protein OHC33_010432 [Knufia fluminis]|uniref:Major facilitator superfamily (MFS) profile domain-containing protein n=1 Tax=Knufia fluminis TaxID=191047 RepID=A0AAN8EYS0_9EURO|nr:hypothetical protein OHC33_010432 [Knufia fluminis]